MTVSKKVTLSADGATATVAVATAADILTTAISTTESLTGVYGLAQKALLFVGGMAVQNRRVNGSFNPF
jgi:hypothetical protein